MTTYLGLWEKATQILEQTGQTLGLLGSAGVSRMASPEGCGCKSGIAPVLRQMGVAVMLAGNMGQGAKNVLEAQRIEVIRGCSGDVEELVAAYLAGNVKDNGEVCDHHDCH